MAWEKPMALILMRFHWFSQNWHNIGCGLHCMAHRLNSQWHTPRSCILCPKGLKHKKETPKVYMKYIQRQKIRESLRNYGKDFPDCHCHQATGWPFAKQTAVHFIVGACKQPPPLPPLLFKLKEKLFLWRAIGWHWLTEDFWLMLPVTTNAEMEFWSEGLSS